VKIYDKLADFAGQITLFHTATTHLAAVQIPCWPIFQWKQKRGQSKALFSICHII